MEEQPEQTTEATSILSPPQRAMVVWLLGKLSLLLAVALLTSLVLFTLELMAEARRVEADAYRATAPPASSPFSENRGHGRPLLGGRHFSVRATPTDLPDSGTALGPTRSQAIAARGRPQTTALMQSESRQFQEVVAPVATMALADGPRAAANVAQPTAVQPAMVPTQTSTLDAEARPVQIRIPAIKVRRSIVELPQFRDSRTGSWTQDLDVLFRKGRKDLVGHYEESAQPGQAGNMILVGHNYGYGTMGVFLKLGRLKQGQIVEVVNAAGQTFAYQVKSVEKVPWRSKDANELVQHAKLLSFAGDERLTLVTCGGASIQPFPARIYVVAEPVRD